VNGNLTRFILFYFILFYFILSCPAKLDCTVKMEPLRYLLHRKDCSDLDPCLSVIPISPILVNSEKPCVC
jgi:hypothetical protein